MDNKRSVALAPKVDDDCDEPKKNEIDRITKHSTHFDENISLTASQDDLQPGESLRNAIQQLSHAHDVFGHLLRQLGDLGRSFRRQLLLKQTHTVRTKYLNE